MTDLTGGFVSGSDCIEQPPITDDKLDMTPIDRESDAYRELVDKYTDTCIKYNNHVDKHLLMVDDHNKEVAGLKDQIRSCDNYLTITGLQTENRIIQRRLDNLLDSIGGR